MQSWRVKFAPADAPHSVTILIANPMSPCHAVTRAILALAASFLTLSASSQQLAFPAAEGSGRFSTGGRGGEVYEVTNLANSGPGSIVDAVSAGNRTIVFRVSGTITLGSTILTPKANTPIAGQTAPGDGICLKGRLKLNASNIIVRHIRVRVDTGAANAGGMRWIFPAARTSSWTT
jgi:pectate lyase